MSRLPGMVGEALHFQLAQVGFSAQILNEVRGQLSMRQARHGGGPSNTQGLGSWAAEQLWLLVMPLTEPR